MIQQLYIGVMSGTSMDGVDTVLVKTNGKEIELIQADFYPMPDKIKQALLNICLGQQTNLKEVGILDHQLGLLFANAVNQLIEKAGVSATDITAIGCHGQTAFHQPDGEYPFSMQLGDANIIAAKTGIQTIADFRRKDLALGGQGAPLVPAFHKTILSHPSRTRVVLNIGGISNISVLKPDQAVVGYDTGPGNMLLDAWVYQHLGHSYDKDGQWAISGKVKASLLETLMREEFFNKPAPKSTGRELFNLSWLENKLADEIYQPQDVQATLTEFTAISISHEVNRFGEGELLVCGGGARNPLIMQRLSELLPDWQVKTTNQVGVDMDYMEAMAFAWLAHQTTHQLAGNLPEVTGAEKAAVLGAIYPA